LLNTKEDQREEQKEIGEGKNGDNERG